jgi:sporulation protein YlmC with PRC-barrel domain
MNGKAKWVLTSWLVVALLPFLAGAAVEDRPAQPPSHAERVESPKAEHSAEFHSKLEKANELIGAKVINGKAERLGTIEDVVLTPDHDTIDYAVLSRGGFLGWGGTLYAVPWSEFELRPVENILVLSNVEPAHLENTPGFDKNNWPTSADRNWLGRDIGRDITRPGHESMSPTAPRPEREGYERRDTVGPMAAAKADLKYRRLSQLVGLTIKNEQGEELGELEDIVLDTHEGKVAYAVLSMRTGFLGLDKDYAAVPWSSFNILPEMGTARLNADKETLEVIAFEKNEFPNLEDMAYSRQLHERFGATPYWEALGFVPGERERPEGRPRDVSPWKEGSEYLSMYNPNTAKTIHGTIESVGSFRLEGTSIEGLRLRIKTNEGETVTVHAGPRPYVDRQDIAFHYGDRVTVTGSPGKLGWRDVLLASQIKVGDKTFDLRTKEGKPKWNADDFKESR